MMALLESSPLERRDELLRHLEKEDRSLALLLRSRTLSLDRILSWPPELLCPLLARLPDDILGRIVLGLEHRIYSDGLKAQHPIDPLVAGLRNLRSIAGSDRLESSTQHLRTQRGSSKSLSQDHHLEVLVVSLARDLEREGLIDLRQFDPPAAGVLPKSA